MPCSLRSPPTTPLGTIRATSPDIQNPDTAIAINARLSPTIRSIAIPERRPRFESGISRLWAQTGTAPTDAGRKLASLALSAHPTPEGLAAAVPRFGTSLQPA